jgi:UDP-N-acetylmuramate dehydrogenase
MNKTIKHLPQVRGDYKFNEPLKKYTWLNVGGPAEVMYLPADIDDLQYFLQNKPQNMPGFVLGSGSNLLVRDGGINGAVIKLENKNFQQWRIDGQKIYCGAGMQNRLLKQILPAHGLGGLEFLCSIPGSLGGAVRSNAGCFGTALSDVLISAKVMNGVGDVLQVPAAEFHFAYRHSEFPADWIILELCLQGQLAETAQIEEKIKQNDEYRKTHQPQGIRTAGSTFKNPAGMRAWELIKNAGMAEVKIGGVRMSSQHCNFLENDGTATALQIEELGEKIIAAVKQKYDVILEWEIERVGKDSNGH